MQVVNEIVMKKLGEIKPYIRNPRKNDKTIELLCEVIPKVGFNVPIVIDSKGIIVKGHARYCAAIKLGMEEVPCVVTTADEEQIKLDRLTDNKISEFSEWVNDELLHELDTLNIDIPEMGFPELPTAVDINFDEEDWDDDGNSDIDEKKRKIALEYLEKNKSNSEVSFVSEKSIQKAEAKQGEIAPVKKEYYKLVCEKCGHISFIDKNSVSLEVM